MNRSPLKHVEIELKSSLTVCGHAVQRWKKTAGGHESSRCLFFFRIFYNVYNERKGRIFVGLDPARENWR